QARKRRAGQRRRRRRGDDVAVSRDVGGYFARAYRTDLGRHRSWDAERTTLLERQRGDEKGGVANRSEAVSDQDGKPMPSDHLSVDQAGEALRGRLRGPGSAQTRRRPVRPKISNQGGRQCQL